MEDTQTKLKQLSENLKEAQQKVTQKKAEIDAKGKSVKDIENEIKEIQEKLKAKVRDNITAKNDVDKQKKEKQKAIEEFKKILGADKDSLLKEKDELAVKITNLSEDVKKLEAEKKELLKAHHYEVPVEEEIKEEIHEGKKENVVQSEIEELTLDQLSKEFKAKMTDTGLLDVECVTKIIDICTAVAGKKFKEQVYDNRKKLRGKGALDLEKYLDQAGKELDQHTSIYQDIEKDVLKQLNVDKALMDKSIEYYVKTGNFEILALMNMLGEKLKSYLRSTKKVDRETFKGVLQTKIDFIEKEASEIFSEANRRLVAQKSFANVAGSFAQKEEPSLMVLKNYFEYKLGTEIFNKYGLEEEDIRAASQNPEIQYDVDTIELLAKVEQAFYTNMPKPSQKPEVQEGQKPEKISEGKQIN